MKQIKKLLRPIYKYLKKTSGIICLKRAVKKGNFKIVIGASGRFEKGWTPTDIDYLNLLKISDWNRFFEKDSIDAILAEHVWEHLDPVEAKIAASHCYIYLKHGGRLRVAVPDGNHPDNDYIEMVKPGGYGSGSDDHKILYTISSIVTMFSQVGFLVKGLEYFDENGNFIFNDWDPREGKINRSKRFDSRNENGRLVYTSLIIDAVKE